MAISFCRDHVEVGSVALCPGSKSGGPSKYTAWWLTVCFSASVAVRMG